MIQDFQRRIIYARKILSALQERGDWGRCFGLQELEYALDDLKREAVFQDRLAGFLAGTPAVNSATPAELAQLIFAYLERMGVLELRRIKVKGYRFTHLKDKNDERH